MKVITIKQPWATLIMQGLKKYEFRTWKTKYRGDLLIHAGLSLDKKGYERVKKYITDDIQYGVILGKVTITDCILRTPKLDDNLYKINSDIYRKSKSDKEYAWELSNVEKFNDNIKVKGKLGLWNLEEKMKHEMKLASKYFDCIKNGTKKIELRLLDDKRKLIKIGDEIEFVKEPDRLERISKEVVSLHFHSNFAEILETRDIEVFSDSNTTKEELLEALNKFYSKEEQEKYGVVGIEIK